MKTSVTLVFSVLTMSICSAQISNRTLVRDFGKLAGSWQGSLTYIDYGSGKPYTMPADVDVQRIVNTSAFIFSNKYPKEASANSVDTVAISNDGKHVDNELVESRKKLANEIIELVTTELGNDGNNKRSAMIKHVYTIGEKSFSVRKDVQFVGESVWIKRHEYTYTRKKTDQ